MKALFSRSLLTLAMLALGAVSVTNLQAEEQVLNLYSARHYQTDEALYEGFTKHTGIKIKRIYVYADQLKALNVGELGVVQLDGRYLLVTADVLAQAEALFAQAVALKVDPNAPGGDDPYADPQYQVPDDLVW